MMGLSDCSTAAGAVPVGLVSENADRAVGARSPEDNIRCKLDAGVQLQDQVGCHSGGGRKPVVQVGRYPWPLTVPSARTRMRTCRTSMPRPNVGGLWIRLRVTALRRFASWSPRCRRSRLGSFRGPRRLATRSLPRRRQERRTRGARRHRRALVRRWRGTASAMGSAAPAGRRRVLQASQQGGSRRPPR